MSAPFSAADLDAFARDGFLKLPAIVPREVADAARAVLWQQIGLSPDDPSSWTQTVVWTADPAGFGPFGQMIGSPRLAAGLDQIAGEGRWGRRTTLGNIPVRFPNLPDAGDTGWHIDLNAAADWSKIAVRSRSLLLLTLFSEVGPDDAPTRIRAGSQRDVAALLGDDEVDLMAYGPRLEEVSRDRPLAYATGEPGDVYICHPLLVHAAQTHQGTRPRFMSQLPITLDPRLDPAEDTPLGAALR
ncbi:phytanoyl-CoA dioxygenase family protein [Herbidospora sp. NBRC 101105]|uniref:phytanoyl-CoA dioxygenase family protein n=1 Tax=Herbidospora sp. NBRC 101105 TaxID=3032195 RepID=UPI0024A2C8DC|nr:phytanoyl-CoA dioxygenase family protein [Herbidospora sp. NBRC 101105]GLX93839.1 phytanoyl-CoA dioxygenase [Herbidospora sp. NBRC 101105]